MWTGTTVMVRLLPPYVDLRAAELAAERVSRLATIQHAHIVAYVAHGESEQGQPYVVTEWLEGEDLAVSLQRRLPAVAECVALLLGASAGLAEAHRRGVVHRELKPSNVFLREGDFADAALIEFGLARRRLRGGPPTRIGVLLGTPEYVAPEQAREDVEVGRAADIFSLGSVLYESLTGRAPFRGEHLTAILVKVLIEEPPAVRALRADVPARLSELITRMLNKRPGERFVDGQALLEAVRGLDLGPEEGEAPPSAGTYTPQERRFTSVAVAVLSAEPASPPCVIPAAVVEAARDLGVRVELVASRSLVATVQTATEVEDPVLRAARCALVMKQHLPHAEVAMASGRGPMYGKMPIGEAVDRALDLLGPAAYTVGIGAGSSPGVWLDTNSEDLLAGRLHVVHDEGRARLCAAPPASVC